MSSVGQSADAPQLYRFPELAAAGDRAPVWVVEGEKDVDALAALGFVATCNPGGAGKWRTEYGEALRGRDIIIVPDADEPGRKHALDVARSLLREAKSVSVLELPDGAKDVAEFIERTGAKAAGELRWLADGAAELASEAGVNALARTWRLGTNAAGAGGRAVPARPRAASAAPRAGASLLARVPPHDREAEESVLGAVLLVNDSIAEARAIIIPGDFHIEANRLVFECMIELADRHNPIDAITLTAALRARAVMEKVGGAAYVAQLVARVPTAANIAFYARIVREMAVRREVMQRSMALVEMAYDGVSVAALVGEGERWTRELTNRVSGAQHIVIESAPEADASNAAYLRNEAIVERLYYTHHISLMAGGKHEGKSSCVRTEAIAIASGAPVWGRATAQTPVLYCASDDEYAATRMELLRMGWTADLPLWMLRVAPESAATPERMMREIADCAMRHGSQFVVLDMLFDFLAIRDEIKYAETRYQIGLVQRLADQIGGHVHATHHSPKWMPDAATAAKAALGSQGIAARFSPIVLARQWAEGLYTIESTATRDPRGLALTKSRVELRADGHIETAGEFREWMKWVLYRDRILDLYESDDPGKGLTVGGVAQVLQIDRARAQDALYHMAADGVLERQKIGRQWRYYRAGQRAAGASAAVETFPGWGQSD
jgi:hypothetical protein